MNNTPYNKGTQHHILENTSERIYNYQSFNNFEELDEKNEEGK
jgi:hypothetical protein